jgi:hypothetical protein
MARRNFLKKFYYGATEMMTMARSSLSKGDAYIFGI